MSFKHFEPASDLEYTSNEVQYFRIRIRLLKFKHDQREIGPKWLRKFRMQTRFVPNGSECFECN